MVIKRCCRLIVYNMTGLNNHLYMCWSTYFQNKVWPNLKSSTLCTVYIMHTLICKCLAHLMQSVMLNYILTKLHWGLKWACVDKSRCRVCFRSGAEFSEPVRILGLTGERHISSEPDTNTVQRQTQKGKQAWVEFHRAVQTAADTHTGCEAITCSTLTRKGRWVKESTSFNFNMFIEFNMLRLINI